MIYFIKAEETPYIKIGYTQDVHKRIVKMQADCPVKLTVIKTVEGDKDYEDELHRKFAAFHYRGEWFKMSESLIEDLTVVKENEEVWEKLENIISKGVFPSAKVLTENFSRLEKHYLRKDCKRINALCVKYLGTSHESLYNRLMEIHELLKGNKRHKIGGILGLTPQAYSYLRKRYNTLAECLQ